MDEMELKEFHSVLITLACQTWTLSCLFRRVPFATSTLQETLVLFEARLKKISNFLLVEQSPLKSDSKPGASLSLQKAYEPLQYSLARTALTETFHLLTPVYALCFALNDYNGTGGTGRVNNPCYLVVEGHKPIEISPTNDTISEIFISVIDECETRLLDILSEFDFFAEKMSVFYPLFSKAGRSVSREAPLLPYTSSYIIRISKRELPESPIVADEIHFGTDPNKIVAAESWNWYVEQPSWQIQVPSIETLQLRDISKPSFECFEGGGHSLKDLDEVSRMLIHLALSRRGKSLFTDIFREFGTVKDNAAAGILLLRDQARVSIGFGRIKEKNLFLFENCLVFARSKSLELVIVQQVSLSDLLQVRYRTGDPRRGNGILTVYWREGQRKGQEVFGAEIFFDDMSVLKIWAAFLTINASTEPAAVNCRVIPTRPWLDDMHFLPRIPKLQEVLSLLSAMKSGALDPDDSGSVLYHLRQLVIDG